MYNDTPTPDALALYMATSARWVSVSASVPWSGHIATPMLTPDWRLMPSITAGSSRLLRIEWASSSAPLVVTGSSPAPLSSTANSSPPRRATVDPGGASDAMRWPSSTSSRSPW